MARTTTGIDVGRRSIEVLRGQWKGGTFHVTGYAFARHEAEDVASAWSSIELPFKPPAARIGLTGRDVNVRYTRVPRVPDWQLRKLMHFEVAEIGDQSGSQVASDFNLLPALPEIEDEDVVLLAMARETLLEEHLEGLSALGGRLDAFSPNALALYVAWLRYGSIEEETVLLANLGHENVDVILVRGPDLVFARNLSGGSKLFADAVAQRFGVSPAKGEEIVQRLATLAPGARYENANQEKASRACLGAAGQLLSLLQSTVMFCKSQVKLSSLKVDRVLLCGGGARLRGLPAYLSSAMGVPVETFDPFKVVETGGLDPAAADLLEEHRLESVVALGLATMASDPEAYSVELLPARVRRAREFWGRTAFLVAAAVLLAAFLGFDAWRSSRQLAATSAEVRQLETRLRGATGVDRRTRELQAENAELADLASELFALQGSGEQLARALRALAVALPQEFWLTRLHSRRSFDADWGIERQAERPILSLEGAAREGTESMAVLFESFVQALRRELPGARLKQRPSPAGDRFQIDLTLLAPAPAAAPAEPGSETDEG